MHVRVAVTLLALQLLGKVQWTGRSLTLLDPTYASKYIPIIASVSEHQPTSWTSFYFDLYILVTFSPVGLYFLYQNISDGAIFIILYGMVAWYFAGVMVRLMLTLAPIACILSAIGLSTLLRRFSGVLKYGNQTPASGVNEASYGMAMLVLAFTTITLCSYSFHATYAASFAYSHPSIVIEAGTTRGGERVIYDDFREAYYW